MIETKRPKSQTEPVGYKLPTELVQLVRKEAFQRRTWPARVVEERLRRSFEERPVVEN